MMLRGSGSDTLSMCIDGVASIGPNIVPPASGEPLDSSMVDH